MADKRIDELPDSPSQLSGDFIHVNQGGVDYREARSTLKNFTDQGAAEVATTTVGNDLTGTDVQTNIDELAARGNVAGIRYSKVDNPLVHLFKKNKLEDTLTGPVTWTRATTATYVDRYGVVQTAAIDTPREEAAGWLIEGASTNEALHSRDYTNAVWVKTNITAAKDAVGNDGVSNAASSLTASAANGTVFQTITKASAENTFSVDVRRKTGAGTIEMTDDGGSTYIDITGLINANTYTRLSITTTQANPSIGFRIVTSTDAIEVDYSQLEDLAFASSRIETTTTSVTRSAGDVTVPFSNNIDGTQNTAFIKYNYGSAANSKTVLQITDASDANNERVLIAANGAGTQDQLIVTSGGASQVTALPTILTNQIVTTAIVFGANSAIYQNGVELSSATSTLLPQGLDTINVGMSTISPALAHYGHVQDFRIYDFELNKDEVKFLSGE